MIEKNISTNENLVQDNSSIEYVSPETNPMNTVQSNEFIFGHMHNGIVCAVCPTAKRAYDRAWVTAKQIEEWSKMSKTTMWRRLNKLEEVGRICSVSDMKHCKMPTNNGGYQDVQLYNLNVLNQLAMVELDCPVLNDTAKKFSDILSEVETTGSYSVNQQQAHAIPKTFPEALRAYADEVERREAAERRAITAEADLASEKEAHEKDNADFRNGLDILNTQKAQISSRREATAMATASSARAHQHFAEKVLETHASELVALRAAMEERRSHLWDANRTAHAIYRLNVLKKEYSLDTLQNKARCLLSHFATKLGKPSIPLPNGATYTDPFGRLQTSVSTYYERDVVDAVLDWVVENPNDFARLGGKRDPLQDEW